MVSRQQVAAIEPVRRIADFLGAASQPEVLDVTLHKQTTESYSELFEKFAEVQAYVAKHHPDLVIDKDRI